MHPGFCVWLTGLSGAGKTTLAGVLSSMLDERGRVVTILDGDIVRIMLSRGLGFSREDRHENIVRVGYVASEIVRHGGAVVCAMISPYDASRDAAREMIGSVRFILVHVDAPLDTCERRDPKGLYARARRGEIKGFTGIDDPYEVPSCPDLHLRTDLADAETCAREILGHLQARGFVSMNSP